jgi:quinoprotein glucose dehydrogenase
MQSSLRFPVVLITAVICALIGLSLAGGGAWLAGLGGSWFYFGAGVGLLVTGALLFARHRAALWVYAAVLIGTLVWAVHEVGFDWWPLAARGDVIFPLGVWLLTPWVVNGLRGRGAVSYRRATAPLWLGVLAGAIVLVIGLSSTYHEIDGTIADSNAGENRSPDGQPDGDWQAYGRTQFGQRYSPLKQITPSNAKNLRVAWTFRTGDQQGPNDSPETTFEVTPIKVRDTLYLCSQHQRLFALDAKTGMLRWSFDPKLDERFHETGLDEASIHGTGIMFVDSSFEKS